MEWGVNAPAVATAAESEKRLFHLGFAGAAKIGLPFHLANR